MSKISITLDPGHVKDYNIGYYPEYREGSKMFILAQYLKEELEKYNLFEVYITRNTIEENPSLEARGKMAIENKSKVFLSLHSNAYSSPTAAGSVIFRSVRLDEKTNTLLGEKLLRAIVNAMIDDCPDTYSRGVKTRTYPSDESSDYYGVIRNSVRDSVVEYSYIIEHGFHSNPKECEWLTDDDNLRELAYVEAEVLADYFGAKLKTEIGNAEEEVVIEEELAVYPTINEVPDWAKPSVSKLIDKKLLLGTGDGQINISYDLTRMIVILDRAGAFGE